MDITSLLIEAVSGAVGGNVAGAAMKKNSLGTVGNSIAGILGGGLGGQILSALTGSGAGAVDLSGVLANPGIDSMVSQIAGGGVGGAVIISVLGAIRTALAKQKAA